ncbi:MAG: Ig-like domain-containing protein [Eubacterium sp.]|nr:Ig-like domain-containing protein [Eubacterium sp.]
MKKTFKKGLSAALALALVVTAAPLGSADANAAKKAKLAKKKLTITVGKKKTVKIKNKVKKAKYTFKSSKKKVATVNKKGVVKAKKAGTAKITVTEKLNGKKRKLGKVKVTVKKKSKKVTNTAAPAKATAKASIVPTAAASAKASGVPSSAPSAVPSANVSSEAPSVAPTQVPSAVPSAAPSVEPSKEPVVTPDATPSSKPNDGFVDEMEKFVTYEEVPKDTITTPGGGSGVSLDAEGNIVVKNQEYFCLSSPIGKIAAGETVYIKIKGINNDPNGFRAWYGDAAGNANSDQALFTKEGCPDGFKTGEFEQSFKITAKKECEAITIKAYTYGEQIKDLVISSIEVAKAPSFMDVSMTSHGTLSEADNCIWDTNVNEFIARDQKIFTFTLPQKVQTGETVTVRIKGTNSGANGFRAYLCPGVDSATSNIYKFTQDAEDNSDYTVGDFEAVYAFTAKQESSAILFKGYTYGENIEELTIKSLEIAYPGAVEIVKFAPNETQTAEMVESSFISSGRGDAVKRVIEKAKKGEDVTIAYLGGSVTEGANATPNNKCYAAVSCKAFADKYGTGDNVKYINAGMSGTPSSLGVVRYERDVLDKNEGKSPDILFLEFAVNDSGECTNGGAYEGIIRRAMKEGTAVVLMFSVFASDWNMQQTYIPLGEYYGLPMVSMKNAVDSKDPVSGDKFMDIIGFQDWYFSDSLHPSNNGYELTAQCIMKMFAETEKNEAVDGPVVPAEPKITDAYENTYLVSPDRVEASTTDFKAGGFSEKDTATGTFLFDSASQKFPTNWKHTATSGSEPLTFKTTCKNLLVVYKLSNSTATGAAELYVDGVKKCDMNGYATDGWNNATTVLAFNEDTAKEHTVEVRMAEGNESKEFTLLALGINK